MTAALMAGAVAALQLVPWDWHDQIPPLTPLTAVQQAELRRAAGQSAAPLTRGLYRASWDAAGTHFTKDLLLLDGRYVETLGRSVNGAERHTTREGSFVQAGNVLWVERRGLFGTWGESQVLLHNPLRLRTPDGQVQAFTLIWPDRSEPKAVSSTKSY